MESRLVGSDLTTHAMLFSSKLTSNIAKHLYLVLQITLVAGRYKLGKALLGEGGKSCHARVT